MHNITVDIDKSKMSAHIKMKAKEQKMAHRHQLNLFLKERIRMLKYGQLQNHSVLNSRWMYLNFFFLSRLWQRFQSTWKFYPLTSKRSTKSNSSSAGQIFSHNCNVRGTVVQVRVSSQTLCTETQSYWSVCQTTSNLYSFQTSV